MAKTIENHKIIIFSKASFGDRNPKKTNDQLAFNANWSRTKLI